MGKYYNDGIKSLHFPEPLSAEDEKAALTRLKVDNDETAKKILVEHNLRLVLKIAHQFALTEEDVEDFFSIGTIGLIKGINTFDINKKIKLSTYISHCINNEILMNLRNHRRRKKWYNSIISYDDIISISKDGNPLTVESIIPDIKANEQMYKSEEIEYTSSILLHSLNVLSNRELIIILYSAGDKTRLEIADILSISRSWVSRIRITALSKMKQVRESVAKSQNCQEIVNKNFVFFMDNAEMFCVKLHPKYTKDFMDFMKNCNALFTITQDTDSITLRLPSIEASYILCAELIKYLTEHVI